MRIGLDLRCLPTDGSEGSGVAHAARALCSRLILDKTVDWIVYLPSGSHFLPLNKGELEGVSFVQLPNRSSSSLRAALRQSPCDVLFVPSGAVSLGLNCPVVPWIHDLTILDHPEWFPESWFRRQFTTRLVLRGIKRAPVVFAVSEHTKQSIVRHAKIEANRVIVTGEGGDEALRLITNDELSACAQGYGGPAIAYPCSEGGRITRDRATEGIRNKFKINGPFVLALGTVEPRKNLAMLIRAWSKVPPAAPDRSSQRRRDKGGRGVELVVAGRDGWKNIDVKEVISFLSPESKRRFHRIENVTDEDRRNLLLAASVVAVPSLDEGFGLVALEAMQAGTPVIASNRGALPEVIGDAGLLLDPTDEGAWTKEIGRISNFEYRMSNERPKIFNSVGLAAAVNALKGKSSTATSVSVIPVQAGIQKEKQKENSRFLSYKFSWENTAKTVLDALKRLS